MTAILSNFKPSTKDVKALVPILVSLFENLQLNVKSMFDDKRENFSTLLRENNTKINIMENEISTLKRDIVRLEDKLQDNDTLERRDTAILSGEKLPIPSPDENTSNLACALLKDNMNITVNTVEISTAHRLGGKNNKKSVIVKSCRRDIKNDLVTDSRRSKPDQFFVNECLTPQRQTISYVLRRAKQESPNIVSGSSSFDGKVYIWVKHPNPDAPGAKDLRHAINNHPRLVDFCNRTLNVPLSHFIKEWTH